MGKGIPGAATPGGKGIRGSIRRHHRRPWGTPILRSMSPSPEVNMAAGRSARRETRRIVRNVRVRTNEERRAAMAQQAAANGGLPRTQSIRRSKRPSRVGRPVSLRAEMDRLAAGGELPSHDRHRRRVQSTADEPPPPNPPARASTATRKTGRLEDYSQFRKHVRHFKRMEVQMEHS